MVFFDARAPQSEIGGITVEDQTRATGTQQQPRAGWQKKLKEAKKGSIVKRYFQDRIRKAAPFEAALGARRGLRPSFVSNDGQCEEAL